MMLVSKFFQDMAISKEDNFFCPRLSGIRYPVSGIQNQLLYLTQQFKVLLDETLIVVGKFGAVGVIQHTADLLL